MLVNIATIDIFGPLPLAIVRGRNCGVSLSFLMNKQLMLLMTRFEAELRKCRGVTDTTLFFENGGRRSRFASVRCNV